MIVDAMNAIPLKIDTAHIATYEQKDADRWICRGPGNHILGVISAETMERIEKETNFPKLYGYSPLKAALPNFFEEPATCPHRKESEG